MPAVPAGEYHIGDCRSSHLDSCANHDDGLAPHHHWDSCSSGLAARARQKVEIQGGRPYAFAIRETFATFLRLFANYGEIGHQMSDLTLYGRRTPSFATV